MSEIKEFNMSELSDEQLAGINGGASVHKAFGNSVAGYNGNPEELIGKTIDFIFAIYMPPMGDMVVSGSAKVTGVGNLAGAPWVQSGVACVTTDAMAPAQVVPLFAVKSVH